MARHTYRGILGYVFEWHVCHAMSYRPVARCQCHTRNDTQIVFCVTFVFEGKELSALPYQSIFSLSSRKRGIPTQLAFRTEVAHELLQIYTPVRGVQYRGQVLPLVLLLEGHRDYVNSFNSSIPEKMDLSYTYTHRDFACNNNQNKRGVTLRNVVDVKHAVTRMLDSKARDTQIHYRYISAQNTRQFIQHPESYMTNWRDMSQCRTLRNKYSDSC